MSALAAVLKEQIAQHGALGIDAYMTLCLSHPEHGYYYKKDPLGRTGDFITAPEVSQVFGELIGVWMVYTWKQMGSPHNVTLVELGAGRGTLMKDALRAAEIDPEFMEAARLKLVETSPALRNVQRDALQKHNPKWANHISELPKGPCLVIANEFFDALPFRQFIKTAAGWRERKVGLVRGALSFVADDSENIMPLIPKKYLTDAPEGSIYEYAPARLAYLQDVAEAICYDKGAALILDYGYSESRLGDTFQAVKEHQKVSVLDHAGDADLTSHVDFENLIKVSGNATPYHTTQGAFLKKLGIGMRTKILIEQPDTTPEQAKLLLSGTERLAEDDQMGSLFKVLCLVHPGMPVPAGFK